MAKKKTPDLDAVDHAMARKVDDGGPVNAMSLRQWYAGKALSAFGGRAWPTPTDSADIARTCRNIADALIAELR